MPGVPGAPSSSGYVLAYTTPWPLLSVGVHPPSADSTSGPRALSLLWTLVLPGPECTPPASRARPRPRPCPQARPLRPFPGSVAFLPSCLPRPSVLASSDVLSPMRGKTRGPGSSRLAHLPPFGLGLSPGSHPLLVPFPPTRASLFSLRWWSLVLGSPRGAGGAHEFPEKSFQVSELEVRGTSVMEQAWGP